MFEYNRDICDVLALLDETNHVAESLTSLIGPRTTIDIIAKDSFWTLAITYGPEHHTFTQDFPTIESLRDKLYSLTIGVKIARWEEV